MSKLNAVQQFQKHLPIVWIEIICFDYGYGLANIKHTFQN